MSTQLGKALKQSGHKIVQVYSRTKNSSTQLANKLGAKFTTQIKNLSSLADIYIIAVKDEAVKKIASKINIKNKVIVHTSGTLNLNLLNKCSENFGIFYPLQTLSKERDIIFKNIPLFIQANNKKTEKILLELGQTIVEHVYKTNSKKRETLHLAAVIASNFSNHMYYLAQSILKTQKIPLSILYPLIEETALKIKKESPKKMQTGPAVRKDKDVIKKQIKMLSGKKNIQKIYKLISSNIMKK